MPNHLIHENSPYLLQHAHNPVDWYPWNAEALERSRLEDRPIFLSIGYAACHWCHVMERESFEDEQIASLMNEHFINIKVDREERTDLDNIYMKAVVAMTGQGGWPMSVFLTPDLEPFYGGTYFPPQRRYNMPSFREVLQAVSRLWREDRSRLLESSRKIADYLTRSQEINLPSVPLGKHMLEQAAAGLAREYDWKYGGWGKAPKFPQPMAVEFLLRQANRGDMSARDMAIHALEAMAKGGIYDLAGGGFARYSTDHDWLIPHFEKMLYDNAQLSLVYLHGWMLTGKSRFRQVCEETLDFILRELAHPLGGFFSSLDADSEGEEGKSYVWTMAEIEAVLGTSDAQFLVAACALKPEGNFEGRSVLQLVQSEAELADCFGLSPEQASQRLKHIFHQLLLVRLQRCQPGKDDKILVSWNALMMAAFAEAGRCLQRQEYLEAARRNARFLLDHLVVEGKLMRSWRDGRAMHNAFLEDHAALVLGLLALYQTDPDPAWYASALNLAKEILVFFSDPSGGFYDTREDHEKLILRPKELQDNATPSGNALAACAFLQLASYEGLSDWRIFAEGMLQGIAGAASQYPSSFSQWLQAADYFIGPSYEVAILGDPASNQAFASILWQQYRPRQVVAVSEYPPPSGSPALLDGRSLIDGLSTAYLCQDFTCLRPTNSPKVFANQIAHGQDQEMQPHS